MTAASLSQQEMAPLLSLLEREASHSLADEQRVLAELLDRALHAPLRSFLERPGKEFRARLCERAFQLAGGRPGALPRELPLAVEALHAGSLIVDDIEDDSDTRRGGPTLHRVSGLPVALNAGNWLYFWPQRLLARAGLGRHARLDASDRMGECLLRCHEGQALDLTVHATAIAQRHLRTVATGVSERKTGALMGLAAAFGGIAAGADDPTIVALDRFGCQLGVGLQMLDDLSGVLNPTRRDKGLEDLRLDRATWVWAFLAEDLDRDAFEALRAEHRTALARVEAGETAEEVMGTLLDALRFRLEVTGLRHAHTHLEQTVAQVTEAVGKPAAGKAIMAEVQRLERGFFEVKR